MKVIRTTSQISKNAGSYVQTLAPHPSWVLLALVQSRECILRCLRASKWDVRGASHRLEQTLQWRRHYGIYDKLTPEYVEPEVCLVLSSIASMRTHSRGTIGINRENGLVRLRCRPATWPLHVPVTSEHK